MGPTRNVRIVAANGIQHTELFLQLVDDLFYALGYTKFQHKAVKPNPRIDVKGNHCEKTRTMMASCLVEATEAGREAITYFRGELELARRKALKPKHVVGYFVSLGGYADGVIEEEGTEKLAIKLLDSSAVIQALEEGGPKLIGDEQAAQSAIKALGTLLQPDFVVDGVDLLVSKINYVKAIYFAHERGRKAVAFIYIDGKIVNSAIAAMIVAADTASGGILHQLQVLAPPPEPPKREEVDVRAFDSYRNWIRRECDRVQLLGLPADEKLIANPPRLDGLFVPLRAEIRSDIYRLDPTSTKQAIIETEEQAIGEIMYGSRKVALLAAPGGGKSTLLKRFATSYAASFKEEPPQLPDGLPSEKLLPLFIRCRDLKETVTDSILVILESIPTRINLPEDERDAFRAQINEALREGQVLLLIDGLDEIPDEVKREKFASNLRAFLFRYTNVRIVVTSRREGFRVVSGVIASVCQEAVLAPFDEQDVKQLCEQWHIQVDGDTPEVREDARALADKICKNKSIFILAQNPLLLTTLLIVRRSIGDLPTRRAALYAEAVRILIKTWNVEGFGSLDEEEAIAQLCFVACGMMEQQTLRITKSKLLALLYRSREVLESELQLVRTTPEAFLDLVEERSSLLMQTGYEEVDGVPEPVYEFRHQTFQEYLAAYGYVEELHEHLNEKPLDELLAEHFDDDRWKEVIPLAVVRARRKGEPTVKRLVAILSNNDLPWDKARAYASLLGQCLLDEVVISPSLLRTGLQQISRNAMFSPVKEIMLALHQGRVSSVLEQAVEESFSSDDEHWFLYAPAAYELSCVRLLGYQADEAVNEVGDGFKAQLQKISVALASADATIQVRGALALIAFSRGVGQSKQPLAEQVSIAEARELTGHLLAMLQSEHAASIYAACWALRSDENGGKLLSLVPADAALVMLLFEAWHKAETFMLGEQIAGTLAAVAPLDREELQRAGIGSTAHEEFLKEQLRGTGIIASSAAAKAAVLMGWYWRAPWGDEELARLIGQIYQFDRLTNQTLRPSPAQIKRATTMLKALGEEGERVIAWPTTAREDEELED